MTVAAPFLSRIEHIDANGAELSHLTRARYTSQSVFAQLVAVTLQTILIGLLLHSHVCQELRTNCIGHNKVVANRAVVGDR